MDQRPVPLVPGAAHGARSRAQVAVEVVHPSRAGSLVEVVDVLGHDEQVVADRVLKAGQGPMGVVGFDEVQRGAALVVEAVHEVGVVVVRLRRGDLHRVVALPQSARVAEGRKAALGGDSCSGEDDDLHAASQPRGSRLA